MPNEWVIVDKGKGKRPAKWGPKYPVPSPDGGQPNASWDDRSGKAGVDHWDVNDGGGTRTRVTADGQPITEDQAHGRAPILFSTQLTVDLLGAAVYAYGAIQSFGDTLHDLRPPNSPHNQGQGGVGPPPPPYWVFEIP